MDQEAIVFVVDENATSRRELLRVAREMNLRAEGSASIDQLLAGREAWPPGCIVADANLADEDYLELLRDFAGETVRPPIILVSADNDMPGAVRAMKAGALNVLFKDCPAEELRGAIEEALRHDTDRRRQAARRARARRRFDELNEGQRAVLELLLAGRSNRAIAEELQLSIRGVEVRRAKLMAKMQAHSLAELVRVAMAAMS